MLPLWPQCTTLPHTDPQAPPLLSEHGTYRGLLALHGQLTLLLGIPDLETKTNLSPSLVTKPGDTGHRSHNHIRDGRQESRTHAEKSRDGKRQGDRLGPPVSGRASPSSFSSSSWATVAGSAAAKTQSCSLNCEGKPHSCSYRVAPCQRRGALVATTLESADCEHVLVLWPGPLSCPGSEPSSPPGSALHLRKATEAL